MAAIGSTGERHRHGHRLDHLVLRGQRGVRLPGGISRSSLSDSPIGTATRVGAAVAAVALAVVVVIRHRLARSGNESAVVAAMSRSQVALTETAVAALPSSASGNLPTGTVTAMTLPKTMHGYKWRPSTKGILWVRGRATDFPWGIERAGRVRWCSVCAWGGGGDEVTIEHAPCARDGGSPTRRRLVLGMAGNDFVSAEFRGLLGMGWGIQVKLRGGQPIPSHWFHTLQVILGSYLDQRFLSDLNSLFFRDRGGMKAECRITQRREVGDGRRRGGAGRGG